MPPTRRVELYREANSRYYYFNKAVGWKHPESNTGMRMVGYTEANLGTASPEWRTKMLGVVAKGYSTSELESTPWGLMLLFLKFHAPVPFLPLGYVGRSHFKVYFPYDLCNPTAICNELNTLFALEQGSNSNHPFNVSLSDTARYWVIRATVDRYMKGAPEAMFASARRVSEQYLSECRQDREPLHAWLMSNPVVRVPFTSHNPDWSYRLRKE